MTPGAPDRIRERFTRYVEPVRRLEWATAAALRAHVRKGRLRRAKRVATLVAIALTFALALVLATVPPGSPQRHTTGSLQFPTTSTTVRSPVTTGDLELREAKGVVAVLDDSSAEKQVSLGEQHLAMTLTSALMVQDVDANVVVSPESIDELLSMLDIGARGETAQQIGELLSGSAISRRAQATGWNALARQLQADVGKATLVQRSTIVLQEQLSLVPTYLPDLKRFFDAGVKQTNFGDPTEARNALAKWARGSGIGAPGLFPPGKVSVQTVAVLLNALQFDANWASSLDFLHSGTKPQPFTPQTGPTVSVPMMHAVTNLHLLIRPGFEAVALPYEGSQYEAVAVEPTSGPLYSMVSSGLVSAIDQLDQTSLSTVSLYLPKFSFASGGSLDRALETSGIGDAYLPAANFSGISKQPMSIATAVEASTISVNETGTGFSSRTAIVNRNLSQHGGLTEVTFDHPFLFLVRDRKTGAIVCDAIVSNPAVGS